MSFTVLIYTANQISDYKSNFIVFRMLMRLISDILNENVDHLPGVSSTLIDRSDKASSLVRLLLLTACGAKSKCQLNVNPFKMDEISIDGQSNAYLWSVTTRCGWGHAWRSGCRLIRGVCRVFSHVFCHIVSDACRTSHRLIAVSDVT